MKALFACTLLVLSAILLGGCPYIEVQTGTKIYPDGTALREVSICEIDDPDSPPTWLTTPARSDAAAEGDGGGLLDRLILPDPSHYFFYERKEKSFRAMGLFDDPGKIVSDYRQPSEYIEKSSTNVFTFSADDYILFKKFAYSEKYTDIVDRDSYYKAVDKGLDILAELYVRVMEKKYGKDYDLSALKRVVETEGKSLARKVARLNYEVRAQNSSLPTDELERMIQDKLLPLLSACGLELKFGEDDEKRMRDFVASKHVELLKPKRPEVPRLSLQQARGFVEDEENEFEKMFEKAIVDKYGSDEAVEKEMGKIIAQVFGVSFSYPDTEFSLEVEMPGIIVSSNGVFSGSKAILEFRDDDLYPLGRTFTVVSVLYDSEALGALSRKTLVTREKIDIARAFLAFEPDVRQKVLKALKEAVSIRSAQPLKELRKDLPTPAVKQLESILRVLE